jgi:hypothetical protein
VSAEQVIEEIDEIMQANINWIVIN